MAKLYPPRIPGSIPAGIKANDKVTIKIPYVLNNLVGINDINKFILKIKDANTNQQIGYFSTDKPDNAKTKGEITFRITEDLSSFIEGNFYKVQLANVKTDNTIPNKDLYYSDVGIVKITSKPTVIIKNYDTEETALGNGLLTCLYKSDDVTEKVYSLRYKIYDDKGTLFEDSGEILHNNLESKFFEVENVQYEELESYQRKKLIENSLTYTVKCTVTTVNNLIVDTAEYKVSDASITPSIKMTLIPELNFDDGYIDLRIASSSNNEVVSGKFIVSRSDDKDPSTWNELFRFQLLEEIPSRHLWIDNTIEQGVQYKYAIQQYNDSGIYSTRIETQPVLADFEYMFLSDGKRQLKLAFNPKVSSFKPIIQATKTDTIGSKYPYIFTNGKVYYHELPLNALISCQLDNANLFITEEEINIIWDELDKITDMTSRNIARERIFKREVLSWLTNGEIKLLRTPTEGNFIVQLMNVSMSPMDQLGRMLHSFSATAYEIEDFSFDSICGFNLLRMNEESNDLKLRYFTIEWSDIDDSSLEIFKDIHYLRIENAMFKIEGDNIEGIMFQRSENGAVYKAPARKANLQTGFLELMSANLKILGNIVKVEHQPYGTITFGQKIIPESDFDKIQTLSILTNQNFSYPDSESQNQLPIIPDEDNDEDNKEISFIKSLSIENLSLENSYSFTLYYKDFSNEKIFLRPTETFVLSNIDSIKKIEFNENLKVNATVDLLTWSIPQEEGGDEGDDQSTNE